MMEHSPTDEALAEQAARMFYKLDGWERYWPFDNMPAWLAPRYLGEPEGFTDVAGASGEGDYA